MSDKDTPEDKEIEGHMPSPKQMAGMAIATTVAGMTNAKAVVILIDNGKGIDSTALASSDRDRVKAMAEALRANADALEQSLDEMLLHTKRPAGGVH